MKVSFKNPKVVNFRKQYKNYVHESFPTRVFVIFFVIVLFSDTQHCGRVGRLFRTHDEYYNEIATLYLRLSFILYINVVDTKAKSRKTIFPKGAANF